MASPDDQPKNAKHPEPEGDRRHDAVWIEAPKLEITLRPAWLHLQCACLISHDAQIRVRFRMMSIQRECAFVIQNRVPEISHPEVSVAEIVKQICAPFSRADECFITIDCLLKMASRIIHICFDKSRARLRKCRRSNKCASHRAAKSDNQMFHTRKFSISSSTSRRFFKEFVTVPFLRRPH